MPQQPSTGSNLGGTADAAPTAAPAGAAAPTTTMGAGGGAGTIFFWQLGIGFFLVGCVEAVASCD